MMKTIESILIDAQQQLQMLIQAAYGFLSITHYDTKSAQQFAMVSLHIRTIHLAIGCGASAEKAAFPCLPPLVRAMWEAILDLDNLLRDPDYWKHMLSASYKERLKLARAASPEKANPFLASVGLAIDLESTIADDSANRDRLRSDSRRELQVLEKAQKAGRVHEYESLYCTLSLDAHNSVLSIQNDYLERQPDGTLHLAFLSDHLKVRGVTDLVLSGALLLESIEKASTLEFVGEFRHG